MAQSSEDTVVWRTAQREANKLLQLNEPWYVRSGATDALQSSMDPCEKGRVWGGRLMTLLSECLWLWVQVLTPSQPLWVFDCSSFHEQHRSNFTIFFCQSAYHSLQRTLRGWRLALAGWQRQWQREIMKNTRVVMIKRRERGWSWGGKQRKKFKNQNTKPPTAPHLETEVDKSFGNTKVITRSQCTICQLCVENRCIHLIILKIYLYMHILFCTAAKHLFGIKMCTPVSILCL